MNSRFCLRTFFFRLSFSAVFVSILGSLGCGLTDQTQKFKDEGKACIWASRQNSLPESNELMSYQEGRSVTVTVRMPTCLSASCDVDRKATCLVRKLPNGEFEISSEGSFVSKATDACSTDCGFLDATCESPPLPAGPVLFRHGTQELRITVPSTSAVVCKGDAPF